MLFLSIFSKAIGLQVLSGSEIGKMAIRALIVYFYGLVVARFGVKLRGVHTPFNFILFILLGSVLANAMVMEEEKFLPVMIAISALLLLNGLIGMLEFYIPFVELCIKGKPAILIKNGQIQWKIMKKNFITEREIFNELSMKLHIDDITQIEEATLSSDGTINFIKKNKE